LTIASEPSAGEPGLGEPGLGEPGLGEPGLGEPGLGEPGLGEPGLGESSAGEPGVGEHRACEHGTACHDGTAPSMATAPEASRAWLLIEHQGPWPAEPTEAQQPGRLGKLALAAAGLGIRVQLIRRPGRRAPLGVDDPRTVFAGWTVGNRPWLRRGALLPSFDGPDADAGLDLGALDLGALAEGREPAFGSVADEPVFLVCVHGRRDVCCARFGVPLAQALAERYPAQVWETTHVSGHRYAGNLVLLPHGLYYGPVGITQATASVEAYGRGSVLADRYRGRAGQPRETQEKEYARLTEAGSLPLDSLS
jgi:hypothetical protein